MTRIGRRAFCHRLGLGVFAAGPLAALAPGRLLGATGPADAFIGDVAPADADLPESVQSLLSPLAPGSRLATSTLDAVRYRDGRISLELTADGGAPFRLEICARDPGPDAPRPVTRTARHDVFVANGGQGDRRTERVHGLAAYALAETLFANEGRMPVSLRTLRARL